MAAYANDEKADSPDGCEGSSRYEGVPCFGQRDEPSPRERACSVEACGSSPSRYVRDLCYALVD